MELVVIKQTFPIAIIILCEKIQVGFFMHFPAGFEYGVEIQVPSASLHHCQSKTEFLVGCCHDDTALIYSAIFKDVAIIFAINIGIQNLACTISQSSIMVDP